MRVVGVVSAKKRAGEFPIGRSLMVLGVAAALACPEAGWAEGADSGNSTDSADAAARTPTEQDDDERRLAPVRVSGSRTHDTYAPSSVETGPYRGLDALDVPATVNVVTRKVLDEQGDRGLYDALRNVAGVTRQQLNGLAYDNLAVRGIPLDNRASYYLNGVLPVANNIAMPMENKERVEVLKGASALYYGFTAPAGVVNMVTRRAGSKPVTTVALLGDINGSIGVHADIARRFGTDDQFGIRVNLLDQHVETPIDGDRGYRQLASVALDWQVTRRLALKYDLESIRQRVVEQAGIVPLPARNGVITLPGLPDPTRLLPPNDRATNASALSQMLRADYLFSDNWSANVTLGQSTTRRDRWLWVFQRYDLQSGDGMLRASQQSGQSYTNRNVRAEVNGLFDTGPVGHDVTFGFVQNWLDQPQFTNYYFTARQNLYAPVSIAALTADGSRPSIAQQVSNRGLYVFDRIALASRWQLVGGLRYSGYRSTQTGSPEENISRTSPSASLLYKLTPQTSVYASYIEGLESAGSAPATASNAGQLLPAAVSRQQEVGIRHRFNGDALLSVALFNLRQPSAGLNADNVYEVNGKARYRGLEFSVQGDVTRDVSVTASGILLDAGVTASSDPALVGKRPENMPRVSGSLFATWHVPKVAGLSFSGGVYYVGPRAVNAANQASIGGYTLFSAGARYATRLFGKHATFQANLENATNKRYWSAAGSNQMGVGLARTLALSSTVAF